MRLISCYVNSFGKLKNQKFDFDNGLTVVKKDNSYGKTTLANFITSMFYDLPNRTSQSASNERRKYDPWHGGIFGGNVEFEYNNRKYKIERDFSKKEFKIFDITNELKKQVFKIDNEAVDGTNIGVVLFGIDKSSFKRSAYVPQDEIMSAELESGLNDKLRDLINNTDENHSLDKSLDKLVKTQRLIESSANKGKLPDLYKKIDMLKGKIHESEINAENSVKYQQNIQSLKENMQSYIDKITQLEQDITYQNELEKLSAQQNHYMALKEDIKTNEDALFLAEPFFKNQDVTKIDISQIKSKLDEVKNQEVKYKKVYDESLEIRTKLVTLQEANNSRNERKKLIIEQKNALKIDIEKIKNDNKLKTNAIKTLEAVHKKSGGLKLVLLCIFTLGIYFIIYKNKKSEIKTKISELDKELSDNNILLIKLNDKITDYDEQIDDIEMQSMPDFTEYENINRNLVEEENILNNLKREMQAILSRFNCLAADFYDCFSEINQKYIDYIKFSEALLRSKQKLDEFLADKDEKILAQKLENSALITSLQQEKIENDKRRLETIKEIAEVEELIKKCDEKAEELGDYSAELELCYEQVLSLAEKLKAIKYAIAFLKEANENLSNQYLLPLLDKSHDYIKMYNGSEYEIEIDNDSKIFIKENNGGKELEYYSKGIKELVSISMRFALMDAIFTDKTKKPFIILDDPFVNLDDSKLDGAKEFIKTLSKDSQIIYLTCHDSRAI